MPNSTKASTTLVNRRFSVAPMMDWTDRYCRYFHRLLSRNTLLYTEMVTTGALIHGDVHRHLHYHDIEHPIALQLGGSDPKALAQSVQIANKYQYDEINLNCGCPSDRVQSGKFGAVLMKDPELVAQCFSAMQSETETPITIKHRIGVDEQEGYQSLCDFVGTIAKAGCKTFIVHARKAWLQGLSPKQNRDVPPLQYEQVFQLKRDFPQLEIIINGGITTLEDIDEHLRHVDGVMVGREAYQNPYFLAAIDSRYFGMDDDAPDRQQVVQEILPYIDREMEKGVPLKSITRHMLGLFQGRPGAKAWRRHISENAHLKGATPDILTEAAAKVR